MHKNKKIKVIEAKIVSSIKSFGFFNVLLRNYLIFLKYAFTVGTLKMSLTSGTQPSLFQTLRTNLALLLSDGAPYITPLVLPSISSSMDHSN